jgi:hypothetical protein
MLHQRQRADDRQVIRAAGLEAWTKPEERDPDRGWPEVRFEADLRRFYAGQEDEDGFDASGGPLETEVISMAEFAARMRARQEQPAIPSDEQEADE